MRHHLRRYPLHVYIAVLFSILTVTLELTLIFFQSRQMSRMALTAAHSQFSQINDRVDAELGRTFVPIQAAIDLLAYRQAQHSAEQLAHMPGNLASLRDALQQSASMSALFVAWTNGDFFQVRLLPADSPLRQAYPIPAKAMLQVWTIQHAAPDNKRSLFSYYDADLQLLASPPAHQPEQAYDIRVEDWFRQMSQQNLAQMVTPMHVFASGEVGATFVKKADGGLAMVGTDITVSKVSAMLMDAGLTSSSHLYLLDSAGRVLLDRYPEKHIRRESDASLVKLAEMGSPMLADIAKRIGQPDTEASMLEHQGRNWLSQLSRMTGPGGTALYLVLLSPEDELLAGVGANRNRALLVALLTAIVSVILVWQLARRATRPVDDLTREVHAIRAFRLSEDKRIHSSISEIHELADAMHLLKSTLRKFLEIGAALAEERNFDRLLTLILKESAAIGRAQAGVIYLATEGGKLIPAAALHAGHMAEDPALVPQIENGGQPGHPAAQATAGKTVITTLTLEQCQNWFDGMFKSSKSAIACAIPLANREGTIIGVLLLLTETACYPQGMQAELIALLEALSGSAAAAIETQRLLDEQKRLLNSFIELIAGAIDAKSPYTGGHCQRVPVIAELLARAACEEKTGPFADFSLNDDEWEALHIASWLHDCGKITTPEHVVDKATRLETLYNRIHEIRTRFEVLKRDAEIACLQGRLAGGDAATLQARLQQTLSELDADFAFVAACNSGEEAMTEEKIARIQRIAARDWQRTLPDRIGLSREELERLGPDTPLPAQESLLADRPEHRIARGPHDFPDPKLGLRMAVPHWLANLGEIHNLTIARGTLNEEERYSIDDHINQTIAMLAHLPFPPRLQQVPEIAGSHHERVDGKGYPRQLKKEDMSVLARTMAIADVFEALTAADRPYKPAKAMSDVLRIMQEMADTGHLDPDIYALFVKRQLWQAYGREYLAKEQMDIS